MVATLLHPSFVCPVLLSHNVEMSLPCVTLLHPQEKQILAVLSPWQQDSTDEGETLSISWLLAIRLSHASLGNRPTSDRQRAHSNTICLLIKPH